ncbi:MAG: ABC transporter substrate-binding protein [Actinomycetota bacterium]
MIVALVAALSLLAAACGDSDDDTSSDAAASETEAPEETEAADGGSEDASSDETEPADTTGDAGGESVTLTWWSFGATGHDNAIAAFEAANPGVSVEVILAGFDEHHEKLLAGFVSGEVPDVAIVEVGYSSLFKANPDNFTDLDATYGAGGLEGDFVPFRWEHGVAPDGTLIGVPTDVGGLAVAYRADLFEAAGLPTDPADVSAAMTTWEDFLALGDEYVAATGNAYLDSSGLLFESVVKQGPEGFYTQDGELIHDTSEHVAEAWSLATSAVERGLSANIGAFTPEWNAAMSNGDYVVQLAPAWMMNYIAGQAPDTAGNWALAEFPEGGGNWGGSQLTIPADAEHPDLAWELIEFISTTDQQASIFQDFGNFPSIETLYDTPEILEFTNEHFGGQTVGAIYAASIGSVEPQFEGRDQRTLLREFTGALGELENGNTDADGAWDTALENIELEIG